MNDTTCMSFKDDLNMFIPRPAVLEKFMQGSLMPEYVFEGTNESEDYAVLFATMLKYSPFDFYGKLVATVEPYHSNGNDVRYFAAGIYREIMKVSVTDWEECIYGYGGMDNVFQGAALIKANMFDGCWIGAGYMDFDYVRRRTTMISSSLKNKQAFYPGTDMVNVDVLKNVSDMLRVIHNMSALNKAGLPLENAFVNEQAELYKSREAGETNFRNMKPEDLEKTVQAVLFWVENSSHQNIKIEELVASHMSGLNPDIFWDLITCGVKENYQDYEGLSREYVKALMG